MSAQPKPVKPKAVLIESSSLKAEDVVFGLTHSAIVCLYANMKLLTQLIII